MSDPFGIRQQQHDPDTVTRSFAPEPVRTLNMLAAITGHAYPICGDTLNMVRQAHP